MIHTDTLESMSVERDKLHGFARAFWTTLDPTEQDTIEMLLASIPEKGSESHKMWKRALITAFAEICKDRIQFMVEELHKEDLRQ